MHRALPYFLLAILVLLSACGENALPPPRNVSTSSQLGQSGTSASANSENKKSPVTASPADQERTLNSLRKLDGYPLYTMTYYGSYDATVAPVTAELVRYDTWACTLVAASGNAQHRIYGRNFDWEFSPAMLLITNPPDGYASISMVDFAYLGFETEKDTANLTNSAKKRDLLLAPLLPFDGMNEYGLTIGMAQVPDEKVPQDAGKSTVGSVRIMRLVLDRARTVDEAIEVMKQYNINFDGSPTLHYMIADRVGYAATVEFKDGRMQIVRDNRTWQISTNFYLTGTSESQRASDWRYNMANQWLQKSQGSLSSVQEAMKLMQAVKQGHTRWSAVYDMVTGEVNIAMNSNYDRIYPFRLPMKSV
jgi:hypothetical protein